MATDGSGGLVYVKSVEGTPHVFASRFLGGAWEAPMRVDWDVPYGASQPAIAAGPRGELLVVWVGPVATVHGNPRYGLYSARLAAGGESFGPSLLVDPNVGEGNGVAPSIAGTAPGKALVAYRVITYSFPPGVFTTSIQLRPGDVMADVRLARFSGDHWSRIGAVNRNPEASMRPPSPTNGPQVGVGLTGSGVVAWQEPDQTGTARIWMRRIFGSTPGPVLQVSPSSWESKAISADVDAFSLAVTPYAAAKVAFRIGAGSGSALVGRELVNTLPSTFSPTGGTLEGSALADGGALSAAGPPDVSVVETSNRSTPTRLAFLAGSRLRQMGGAGALGPIAARSPSPGQAGTAPVVAVDPNGGGIVAYPSLTSAGAPAVAVRQEFGSGAVQTGLVSGNGGGPVAELSLGRSELGDGLLGFRQGEAGRYQIVADRISVPPTKFKVTVPKAWVRPRAAKVSWEAPQSAVGALRYSVLVAGRTVRRGLRRRVFRPGPSQLGEGILRTQVLATDALGQQLLSGPVRLRVDGEPPEVAVRVARDRVSVRLADRGSGLALKGIRVSFGDGARGNGSSHLVHAYAGPGKYRVRVRARDEVGNRVFRQFEVRIR